MTNPVTPGFTTTNQMVEDLQQRLPMGLDGDYCMLRLNQAYAWIEQQGAFVWNITRLDNQTLLGGSTHMNTPDDMDVGKPASLYPYDGGIISLYAEVPYLPMDEMANQQIFHLGPQEGVFSVWTLVNQEGDWKIRFAPQEAVSATDTKFVIFYHKISDAISTPPTQGGASYPTPPAFDQMIVDLAEAEIRRLYGLMGWRMAVDKATGAAKILLDKYRSPKRDLAGIGEQSAEVNEKQLNQAQVS